jgi:hypothetical protein
MDIWISTWISTVQSECNPEAKAARRGRPGGSTVHQCIQLRCWGWCCIQRTQISNWRDRSILESTHKFISRSERLVDFSDCHWCWSVLSGCGSSVTETSQVAIWRTSKRSCEMGGPHATKLDVFCASTRRQKSGWAWRRLTGDRASPIIPIIQWNDPLGNGGGLNKPTCCQSSSPSNNGFAKSGLAEALLAQTWHISYLKYLEMIYQYPSWWYIISNYQNKLSISIDKYELDMLWSVLIHNCWMHWKSDTIQAIFVKRNTCLHSLEVEPVK